MKRAAALCIWLLLPLSSPQAAPDDGLRRLASELARKVALCFPVVEGSVSGFEGALVRLELSGESRQSTPDIDFFRAEPEPGRVPVYRRIGGGRLLSVEGGRATAEVLFSSEKPEVGDRVRSSLERHGIGILFSGEPRPLRELLALRVALELNSQGRFRAELLDAGDEARASWLGLRHLLFLSDVEDGEQVTLIGRLVSLRDSRTVDLISSQVPQDKAWPGLLASLEGTSPSQPSQIEHFEASLDFQAAAVLGAEFQDRACVFVLGRSEVRLYSAEGQGLKLERSWRIPEEYLLPSGSRDFLGELAFEAPGRLRIGHTLLRQSLALDLGSSRWEPKGRELALGDPAASLSATYQAGANRLEALHVSGQAVGSSSCRFARRLGNALLLQGLDYRLRLLDPRSGGPQAISGPLGSGVSLLELPDSKLVAATDAVLTGPDHLTLYRLESQRLNPAWTSEPFSNPVRVTSLGQLRDRVCLAALESTPTGPELHLYVNLPSH